MAISIIQSTTVHRFGDPSPLLFTATGITKDFALWRPGIAGGTFTPPTTVNGQVTVYTPAGNRTQPVVVTASDSFHANFNALNDVTFAGNVVTKTNPVADWNAGAVANLAGLPAGTNGLLFYRDIDGAPNYGFFRQIGLTTQNSYVDSALPITAINFGFYFIGTSVLIVEGGVTPSSAPSFPYVLGRTYAIERVGNIAIEYYVDGALVWTSTITPPAAELKAIVVLSDPGITITGMLLATSVSTAALQIDGTFPLTPDWGYRRKYVRPAFVSLAEDGRSRSVRYKGERYRVFDVVCADRSQIDEAAFDQFEAWHRLDLPFWFEDVGKGGLTKVTFDMLTTEVEQLSHDGNTLACVLREV